MAPFDTTKVLTPNSKFRVAEPRKAGQNSKPRIDRFSAFDSRFSVSVICVWILLGIWNFTGRRR